MKTTFPFFITFMITLTFGCGSKDWEDELSVLLQEEAQLHELYRNGKLSESAYSNSVSEVTQSSLKIINAHKKELFHKHVDALQETDISSEVINVISNLSRSEKLTIELFWSERQSGDELIRMNPMGMTHVVLARQLTIDEYKSISAGTQPVHLLDISDHTCKTAMLNSNAIYTVGFKKEQYYWTPVEVYKYKRQ